MVKIGESIGYGRITITDGELNTVKGIVPLRIQVRHVQTFISSSASIYKVCNDSQGYYVLLGVLYFMILL